MKTAITIHIAERVFTIDEDAHVRLEQYLQELRAYFAADATEEEAKEIMDDIENRIAEILTERLGGNRPAVTIADVEFVMTEMGTVDAIAKEEHVESEKKDIATPEESWRPGRKLYRDPDGKVIAGVCAGLAAYFDIDVTFIRIAFLLLLLLNGVGILIYFILWIAMPEAETAAEKAAMRGKRANITTIEKTVKERLAQGLTEEDRERARTGLQRFYAAARELFQGLGRVLLALLKVLGGIISFIVAVGGLLIIAISTAAFVQLLVGGEHTWFMSPVSNIVNVGTGIDLAFLISVYVTVVLIGLFCMLIANQIMRKGRNPFAWVSTLVFALICIAGIVALTFGLRVAPDLQARYEQYMQIVTEERVIDNLDTFTGIDIDGGNELYVSYAEEPSVRLIGDKRVLDTHELVVVDGILQLRNKNRFDFCFIWCHIPKTQLIVQVPTLSNVTMSGATSAEVSALPSVEQFTIDASGSSDATIEMTTARARLDIGGASTISLIGSAEYMDANISGASALQAVEFTATDAKVDVSGASSAAISVTNVLTATASGASSIEYAGNPTVQKDVSGSSTVQEYKGDVDGNNNEDIQEEFEADAPQAPTVNAQ